MYSGTKPLNYSLLAIADKSSGTHGLIDSSFTLETYPEIQPLLLVPSMGRIARLAVHVHVPLYSNPLLNF